MAYSKRSPAAWGADRAPEQFRSRAAAETGSEHTETPTNPQEKPLAIHSWGKPIFRGSVAIGYVTVTDRGWGGFTPNGQLLSAHHTEDAARRAVLDHGARSAGRR